MWLYLPNTLTSSASAPAAAGSISESSWLCPALAASLWWRGKPSPSRTWSQRLSKVSWLQRLIWDDVRTFNGRPWRGLVDGLIGGIPCQPHSLAGKKQGRLDARDLWSSARRIVVQSGAWWVLIENVGGMLAAGADEVAGAERVWRDLRSLGFAVEAGLFTAAEVGDSQKRERVFILGVADPLRSIPQWRRSGSLSREGGTAEREARVGQWRRHDLSDGGAIMASRGVADAQRDGWGQGDHGPALRGRQPEPHSDGGARAPALARSAIERLPVDRSVSGNDEQELQTSARGGGGLVVAESVGRREGRPGSDRRRRRNATSSADGKLVDTERLGQQGDERRGEQGLFVAERVPLFPPGPGDFEGWRRVLALSSELEPAVRRVADGVASGLDDARSWARVDRLRLDGNGVVPLEAAHAIRTLVTRLAARGAAGATELAGMMRH